LEENVKKDGEDLPVNDKEESVYVKKWTKTRHAVLFRLSNKIVQVKFQDHTEIILSSESRMVTYINKKQEKNVYRLSSALESDNPEMSKRLKYTKELLASMLNNNREHDEN
jgi:polo-like kinase 1